MSMNPDFGGITRPHGTRSIKDQIRAMSATENVRDVDKTGKLASIIAQTSDKTIGDPPRR